MTCNEWQNIILTDYMDDQLKTSDQKDLEQHLQNCPACAAFTQKVTAIVKMPFDDLKRTEVSEVVWQNIQDQITEEESVIAADLPVTESFDWARLLGRLLRPQWGLALVSVGIIVGFLYLGFPVQWARHFQGPNSVMAVVTLQEDSNEVLEAVLEDVMVVFVDEEAQNYGTFIEEIFL